MYTKIFTWDRETKNKIRYKIAYDEDSEINGMIYIDKSMFTSDVPESIEVNIKEFTEDE